MSPRSFIRASLYISMSAYVSQPPAQPQAPPVGPAVLPEPMKEAGNDSPDDCHERDDRQGHDRSTRELVAVAVRQLDLTGTR